MSKLLAIEAASDGCSVALQVGDQVISRLEQAPRMHSRVLYPMLDDLMAEAGLSPQQLDAVVFGKGPGSFTGLRIAAATAQGIGFGADIPLIGVSTLQCMAQAYHQQSGATQILPILDARMSELYFGAYQWSDITQLMEPVCEDFIAAINVDSVHFDVTHTAWAGCGNGWKLKDQLAPAIVQATTEMDCELSPEAKWLLPQAVHDFQQSRTIQPEQVELVYLRDQSHWKTIEQQQSQKPKQ